MTSAQEWGTYVERLANPSHTANSLATVSNSRTQKKKNLQTKRRTSYNGNNLTLTDTNLEIKSEKSDNESVSEKILKEKEKQFFY